MKKRKKDHFVIKSLRQARRIIVLVVGLTVLLFGAAMLFLPGPGLATIVIGLALLGTEFVWARKLMKRFERHAGNLKNSFMNNFHKTKN